MHHLLRTALACILVLGPTACSESDPSGPDAPTDTIDDPTAEDTTTEVTDVMDAPETTDPDATDPVDEDGFVDTIGRVCGSADECQNGLYCDGEEECPYGFCTAGSLPDCSDGVNCTLDTCNEETDSCDHEVDDTACDDDNPCTTDSCDVSTDTCINTEIDCADTVVCTLDTCDTSTGDCVHTISDEACDDLDDCTIDTCDVSTDTCANTLIDGDGDLHAPESCGGDDCDDTDDTIYTGAPEVCDDGIDQDCDGSDMPPGGCDCPVSLSIPMSYTGDTTSGATTHDGSCGTSTGAREIVHELVLTAPANVHVDAGDTSYYNYFYLYAREGSCTGTEIGCAYYWGDPVSLNLSLSAGTYYFFVDGEDSYSYGAYELNVDTFTPVTGNDTCGAAYTLTANGLYGGDNTSMTGTADPSTCASSSSGNDVWFTFTLSSSTTVTFETFASNYDTVLYVQSGTCGGSEIDCDDDGGHSLDSFLSYTFPAGTYYLVLDAYDSYETGAYTLSVTGLP